MDFTILQTYLLDKPASTEETPFGPDPLVYKVKSKIFALVAWNTTPLKVSLKCRPVHALMLRAEYPAVQPGYHLNKEHWNTVTLDGSVPEKEVRAMIDESYRLVVRGLTKRDRDELGGAYRADSARLCAVISSIDTSTRSNVSSKPGATAQ